MVKPPSKRIASEASEALRKGYVSPQKTRSIGGRVEAERAALKKHVAPKSKKR
jgi:hypothetical protein